ncbi:MAG TPA: GAF domain-containing sensor histidine kinase [Ktedonobacterales bacterium]|nr:GAF domain-containing sensor histidine kinase [Ktedonobacterales bacterium]
MMDPPPEQAREPEGSPEDDSREVESRLLRTLEHLLQLDATDLTGTLNAVAQLVGEAVSAEKVDLFLYHPENHTLQVAGISATLMSRREVELGLDRIAVADRGRIAEVFETGVPFVTGHADRDPVVMRGLTEGLGVRSMVVVLLDIGEERRGVFQAASSLEDAFSEHDIRFFQAVKTWVGLLVQRAELIEHLTATVAEQARRLAADELITLLAHDLGNLLSPISMRLQLLRRQAERKGRTSESSDLQGILAGVARLQGLIRNLLDTARLDQGLFTIEPETCDLTLLVEDTVALLHAPTTPIHLHAEPHVLVQADPARLRQVIENLIENALLHAPPKTPVSISVTIEPQAQEGEMEEAADNEDSAESLVAREWALVTVQNEGPGIPSELLPHLFERYVRGQRSLGLGLGLYVSHQIALAHGGNLTADSTPGHGARFTLRLPFATDILIP